MLSFPTLSPRSSIETDTTATATATSPTHDANRAHASDPEKGGGDSDEATLGWDADGVRTENGVPMVGLTAPEDAFS